MPPSSRRLLTAPSSGKFTCKGAGTQLDLFIGICLHLAELLVPKHLQQCLTDKNLIREPQAEGLPLNVRV